MLGKNQAKIFLRWYYEQPLSNFSITLSPYKPSQTAMLFRTAYLPLSELIILVIVKISENIFFFLNLLMQKIFFEKNHWFQLLSTKNVWIVSLFLISITLHCLTLNHSIMSSFCWQKNNLWLSMKTWLLLLTKSHNLRKFCLLARSLCFFRVFFFLFSFFGLFKPLL